MEITKSIKSEQQGGAESAPAAPVPQNNKLKDETLKVILNILEKCNSQKATLGIDNTLDKLFLDHGFMRGQIYDGYQYTGVVTNPVFDRELIESFIKKAGYIKYGDKFIKY